MHDKEFERLIKLLDQEEIPPAGLKEQLYAKVVAQRNLIHQQPISPIERFVIGKPVWASCAFSVVISVALWLMMGNDYANLLNSIIRIR